MNPLTKLVEVFVELLFKGIKIGLDFMCSDNEVRQS